MVSQGNTSFGGPAGTWHGEPKGACTRAGRGGEGNAERRGGRMGGRVGEGAQALRGGARGPCDAWRRLATPWVVATATWR